MRNASDGSVEIEVQGSEAAVGALLQWAETGPVAARVDRVAVSHQQREDGERDSRVRS